MFRCSEICSDVHGLPCSVIRYLLALPPTPTPPTTETINMKISKKDLKQPKNWREKMSERLAKVSSPLRTDSANLVRANSPLRAESHFVDVALRRRNYTLSSHRRDGLIEWMKDTLYHSFALDAKDSYIGTMAFFEELIEEHRRNPSRSRLLQLVPTVGIFHTPLPLVHAFKIYDNKYSISQRRHIAPSFNEIRHMLNLAQIIAIGDDLQFMSFDGDQTLYNDGGNFDAANDELALAIIRLLCHNVKVSVITAASYGWDGEKYERRLRGLLDRFIEENMTKSQVENFFIFGGECNYLFRCTIRNESDSTCSLVSVAEEDNSVRIATRKAVLLPVPIELWHESGPKPHSWDSEEIKEILDVAEATMRNACTELRLRAKVLRKERTIGTFPGGAEMCKVMPTGHGSNRLKKEALDEIVLRVLEALRSHEPAFTLPVCVFNGGTDAWLDIGNKSIAVQALQSYLHLTPAQCIHVGDQFYNVGNDIAARETCACIWISSPRETGKVLQHVLKYKHIAPITRDEGMAKRNYKEGDAAKMHIYTETGEGA